MSHRFTPPFVLLEDRASIDAAGRLFGARNSIFVEHEGRLLTPLIRAGALPGVLRADLIAKDAAFEAELSLEHLRAKPILIGNSLWGLRCCALA